MRVFLSGISGQDGGLLARLCLSEGHEVFGLVRRHSTPENQTSRIDDIESQLGLYYGDLNDTSSIVRSLLDCKPDIVLNIGAQSHVRISFDCSAYTVSTNALGALNVLDATRRLLPNARFYQASSSEMFGTSVDADGFQRLSTPMTPTSPYGCAKLFAFKYTQHVRRAYGFHACNGILFNHEGKYRGANFVTAKVVRGALAIQSGKLDKLRLGAIDSKRDWGNARDYVRAIWKIVNYPEPRDWVVATGETRSVRDLCEYVFRKLGMNYEDYVVANDKAYLRPEELTYLRGDSTETRELLGWQPEFTFEQTIDEIIEHWQNVESQRAANC